MVDATIKNLYDAAKKEASEGGEWLIRLKRNPAYIAACMAYDEESVRAVVEKAASSVSLDDRLRGAMKRVWSEIVSSRASLQQTDDPIMDTVDEEFYRVDRALSFYANDVRLEFLDKRGREAYDNEIKLFLLRELSKINREQERRWAIENMKYIVRCIIEFKDGIEEDYSPLSVKEDISDVELATFYEYVGPESELLKLIDAEVKKYEREKNRGNISKKG